MSDRDAYKQVIANFEALQTYLNSEQASDQARNLTQILFAPNQNLEILIAKLLDIDGTRDFTSFMKLHKEIVNYITELDLYLQRPARFNIADLVLLEQRHHFETEYRFFQHELEQLTSKVRNLKLTMSFLDEILPQLHHKLFDDPSCPNEVYNSGRRCLTDRAMRTRAQGRGRDLLLSISSSPESFLQETRQEVISIQSPRTSESITRGAQTYLDLTIGAVLIEAELSETEKRINIVTSQFQAATVLPPMQIKELRTFRSNNHPAYNTGTYAGYLHTITPRILSQLAQEIAALGGKVSLNINLE